MEGVATWLNQKLANFLGDFKDEREPEEDPGPTRAVCRIFFVVSLIVGFSFLLAYNFKAAPDVRVLQIRNLKPGGKNQAFPGCFLYDRSLPACKKWEAFRNGTPVVCPCGSTSVSWREFVSFYILRENSTEWGVTFDAPPAVQSPIINVPPADSTTLGNFVAKDTQGLTVQKFCEILYMWPVYDNTTTPPSSVADNLGLQVFCLYMASSLFPGSDQYRDTSEITQFLESPTLLARESLNVLIAQLARESVLRRRLELDMMNYSSITLLKYYNALANLLTDLLDRDKMEPWLSYYNSALDLKATLATKITYDPSALVSYLGEPDNQAGKILWPVFLYPEIDWKKYREACNPVYCEVTKPMRDARKLYWAFGFLGGVASIVLGFVTMLLWPVVGFLLRKILKSSRTRRADANGSDLERPRDSLWSGGPGSNSAPL